MHQFSTTHDGIDRASLQTLGAADAARLINPHHSPRPFNATLGIKQWLIELKQLRQRLDGDLTTWWAAIDLSFAQVNGDRVGKAAWVAAACALRLRELTVNG
jgi:hypothetical protein